MQNRCDDMPRAVAHRLHDKLTKVGFVDVNAHSFECRIERNLFRRHRLRLDDPRDLLISTDLRDNSARLGLVGRVVDNRALVLGLINPLVEVVRQVGDCMGSNLARLLAQRLMVCADKARSCEGRGMVGRIRDRTTRERTGHRLRGALLERGRRQFEGIGLMRWLGPAGRQWRAPDVFSRRAHASASAIRVARWTARTGVP